MDEFTALTETRTYCPYCGEGLSVLLDPSEMGQDYIEDCQVCCRPIVMRCEADMSLAVRCEDDVSFE